MLYRTLKWSEDSKWATGPDATSIDGILLDINHRGSWASLEALRTSIRKWSKSCVDGDIYWVASGTIHVVATATGSQQEGSNVCYRCGHEVFDYGDLVRPEQGGIAQLAKCQGCGEEWMDFFALKEQCPL